MALDIPIQTLLRSSEVAEINFNMSGLLVTGQGFLAVSNRISDTFVSRRIRITVRPQLVPQNADAAYDPTTDKLNLRSMQVLTTQFGPSDVVHECTHAQIDYRRLSSSIRTEEGAAFIAETWFMLARGLDTAVIDNRVSPDIRTITQNLRTQAQSGGGVANVSADQLNAVRAIMGSEFGYRMGHYTSNGIRGGTYRGD